jgi:hypothetical protein
MAPQYSLDDDRAFGVNASRKLRHRLDQGRTRASAPEAVARRLMDRADDCLAHEAKSQSFATVFVGQNCPFSPQRWI